MVLVDISEHNRTFCDVAACRHGFRDLVLKVATHFWGAPVPESDAGIEIYDTHEPYIIFEYTVEKVKVEVHKIDVLNNQVCPQGFDFGYIKGFGNLYNPISRMSEKVPQSSWGTFSRTANDRSDLVPKWVFSEIISIMYYNIIPLRTWILLSQIFWTSDPRSRVLSIVFSGNHRVKMILAFFNRKITFRNQKRKFAFS